MRRIVVMDPFKVLGIRKFGIHNYMGNFIKKYSPIIYISEKITFRLISEYVLMFYYHRINPFRLRYHFSMKKIKDYDCLINHNGYSKKGFSDLKGFKGKIFFHLMDFIFHAKDASVFLKKNKIDYILGYADHGKYSDFFGHYFKRYEKRCISIPFGFHPRFKPNQDFAKRKRLAVALGSVNPVNDTICCNNEELIDFVFFFKDIDFAHPIRRYLVLNKEKYESVIDVRLPIYPQTKDFSYDAVKMMNDYQMFINDESVLNFPPARTYEGIGAGCVMVCTDNQIYMDLGFVDGVNCIMFRKGDYDDMVAKIRYYQKNQKELLKIQKNSLKLAYSKFTHEKIAEHMYAELVKRL